MMPDNIEKVSYSSGTENDLNLWVRADAAAFLPVELIDFDVRRVSKQANLSWQTASESNNDGFQIQRSSDSRKWEMLSFVPGKGTTQESQSYTYTDEHPLLGMNYYRLQQIDFDGQSAYSKVVGIELENSEGHVQLFPNPCDGDLSLALDLEYTGEATFTLYDFTGRRLKTLTLSLDGGISSHKIDLGGMPAGIFLVQVQAGAKTWQQRLVLK